MSHSRGLDSGRSPFELFLLGLSLLSGIPLLLGAPPPQSTADLLSPTLVHVWAGILVFGSAVALVGIWWSWWGWLTRWVWGGTPKESTGLLIEQVGMVAVGGGTLIYGIGILVSGPSGRGLAASIVLAYGLACFWRAWQIQRWVRAAIRQQDH